MLLSVGSLCLSSSLIAVGLFEVVVLLLCCYLPAVAYGIGWLCLVYCILFVFVLVVLPVSVFFDIERFQKPLPQWFVEKDRGDTI